MEMQMLYPESHLPLELENAIEKQCPECYQVAIETLEIYASVNEMYRDHTSHCEDILTLQQERAHYKVTRLPEQSIPLLNTVRIYETKLMNQHGQNDQANDRDKMSREIHFQIL